MVAQGFVFGVHSFLRRQEYRLEGAAVAYCKPTAMCGAANATVPESAPRTRIWRGQSSPFIWKAPMRSARGAKGPTRKLVLEAFNGGKPIPGPVRRKSQAVGAPLQLLPSRCQWSLGTKGRARGCTRFFRAGPPNAWRAMKVTTETIRSSREMRVGLRQDRRSWRGDRAADCPKACSDPARVPRASAAGTSNERQNRPCMSIFSQW